jgi:hypothetical protein
MKRILVTSTYTIKNPTGGGQKRVEAIVQQYKGAGHDVRHSAIYLDTAFIGATKNDIAVPWVRYDNNPLAYVIGDLLLSDSLDHDDDISARFREIIQEFNPDIIHVEQVFLFKTIKGVLDRMGWKGVIVNSTHNIEAPLKEDILRSSTSLTDQEIQDIIDSINQLEKYAAQNANYTVACTNSDASFLKKRLGAKEVILAPNGINKSPRDDTEIRKVKNMYGKRGVDNITLYVGSAHPPNLTGFVELVGSRVGFLKENSCIVVAGGVANLIHDYAKQLPNYQKVIFFDKVDLLGIVSERRLSALLYAADQIILPILEGGGSNLKTAEAILSGKKIVATTKSFRSYENYLSLPGIRIADTNSDFRRAIADNAATKVKPRTDIQKELASGVEWRNTLREMVERAERI